MMTSAALRLAAFAFGLGVALPHFASAAQCPSAAVTLNVPAAADEVTTNSDGSKWTLHLPGAMNVGSVSLGCASAPPACKNVTMNLVMPATTPDPVATNPDGSTSTLHIPNKVTLGTLTLTCPAPGPAPGPAPLANGRYTIWNASGLAPDAGWSPDVGVYSSAGSGNSCQKWIWNGTTLQTANLGSCAGITGYLVDSSGRARLAASGDTFSLTSSGSGWIIKDLTTGRYLALNGTSTGNPGALLFSPTIQTIWTATAN